VESDLNQRYCPVLIVCTVSLEGRDPPYASYSSQREVETELRVQVNLPWLRQPGPGSRFLCRSPSPSIRPRLQPNPIFRLWAGLTLPPPSFQLRPNSFLLLRWTFLLMASFSNTSHSSGIDFHITPIGFHPDVIAPTGSNLQRNKTERSRLQGLMRTGSATDRAGSPNSTTMGWKAKYQAWMVNEGGKKIFFSVFILLHLLVLGLGFLNYDLNDNLVNARRTFGITYRELHIRALQWLLLISLRSYCPCCCLGAPCGRCLHSLAHLPKLHFSPAPNTSERHNTI
jgi:hypothetical protein